MKGKGGEEDFRAFPQFKIYHYTIDHHHIVNDSPTANRLVQNSKCK